MSETWKDPIVEEVRRIRRQRVEEFGNDPSEYVRRLMESQKKHGDKLVCRKPVPLVKSKVG